MPAALQTPAMSRDEPLKFSPGGVAQHDLAVGLELVEHRVGRPVAARRVLGRDRERVADARTRPSTPCDALTTSSPTWRQTKRSDVFGSSAPDSSPASHSTWKPLQIPSTSPPWRAKRSTSPITGAKRAIAPTRR